MSAIYFHSQSGTQTIRGAERHWFGGICSKLFVEFLGLNSEYDEDSPLRSIISPEHYLAKNTVRKEYWLKALRTAATVGGMTGGPLFLVDGDPVDIFTSQLNTAIDLGSAPVRLAARLHGQCEIHAYVEGHNRAWLAGIIQQGLDAAIFRDGMGWQELCTFLLSCNDEPVVTSYSVCEQFPNGAVADFVYPEKDGDKDWDAWYELPEAKQWEMALAGIRKTQSLEINPDSMEKLYFGDGLNAMEILRYAVEQSKKVATAHD